MASSTSLKLADQLCFPLYASSRMLTRMYQPLLDELNLTYPQYIVLMVLWEHKKLKVSDIGNQLLLNTNTLTPLLKKMMDKELISKTRSDQDERTVWIELADKGQKLKQKAECIPNQLLDNISMSREELKTMRTLMNKFLKEVTTK